MSRKLRTTHPFTVQHVISRFVDHQWLIQSPFDRSYYLFLLGCALLKSDWRCFSFAVMSNHIHLGLLAGTSSLASLLRKAHCDFASHININRQRIGAVFVRGPNVLFPEAGVNGARHLLSYIHCNPVRAGVVSTCTESDWTSHRDYLGLDSRHPWLDVNLGLELCGFHDAREMDQWIAENMMMRADVRPKRGRPRRRRREPFVSSHEPEKGPTLFDLQTEPEKGPTLFDLQTGVRQ